MADTASLIERLEKATGPDRELDRDIHWMGVMRYIPNGGDSFIDPHTRLANTFKVGSSPHYTSSIDAAMTLVQQGLLVVYIHQIGDEWHVLLGGVEEKSFYHGVAASLPLALCIAALKAMSQP